MTRRQRARAGWVGGALALALGTLVGWRLADDSPPEKCAALDAHPVGVGAIEWDNGYTATGGSWLNVLRDGVEQARPDQQDALAAAVAADEDGYQRLLAAIPPDARPAAERLHALVLDPAPASSRRSDPDVQADIDTLSATRRGCPGVG